MKDLIVSNHYLIRSPLFSINSWNKQFNGNFIENLIIFFDNEIVKEALYLSSSDLYDFINSKQNKYDDKVLKSLTKYLSRLTYRCTPFGFNAGVNVGEFSSNTTAILRNQSKKIDKRVIRLDNDFIFSLIDELVENEEVRSILTYIPNTSLYQTSKKYRFIEYNIDKNKRRNYSLSQINRSSYLDDLLILAKDGIDYHSIRDFFLVQGATKKEIKYIIKQLINDQILIASIRPSITKLFLLEYVHNLFYENFGENNSYVKLIKELTSLIHIPYGGKDLDIYHEITKKIKVNNLPFENKNLFQVDHLTNYDQNTINEKIRNEIKHGTSFLSLIPYEQPKSIEDFTKSFKIRYDNEAIKLVDALDPSSGIGYPTNSINDVNPLLDSISFPINQVQGNLSWNWFSQLLLEKYFEFCNGDQVEIQITWEDVPLHLKKPKKIEKVFAAFVRMFSNNNDDQFYLKFIRSNPIQLIGRFAYLDEKILKMVNEIVDYDQRQNNDEIFAEILHIPENRLGNVIQHPPFYKYGIPYLSNHELLSENVINISDLFLKVDKGELVLFSKLLNKRIIPRLCNAHVHGNSSLSIYRFLCDYENKVSDYSFHTFVWPSIFSTRKFLPRVKFRNMIISKAKWKIDYVEIQHLYTKLSEIVDEFTLWRETRFIPQFIVFSEGDNELLLNLNEKINISILMEEIKKYKSVYVMETIFQNDIVPSLYEKYHNEILFILKNEE